MNSLLKALAGSRLFRGDLDYHLVRASMVLVFLASAESAYTTGGGRFHLRRIALIDSRFWRAPGRDLVDEG
jgi:hypothetical protein